MGLAAGPQRDHAPIVAPGHQSPAVADSRQDRRVRVDDDALLFVRLAEEHDSIRQRQRRRAVEERRRYDMRAGLDRPNVLGERGGRLGLGHANE